MTPAFRRIAIAAVAIALVAAACGGSDPNSETPADTVGYHGDPDLSYDDTGSDDDTADDHDTDSDDSDTADDTGSDDDTADDHDTDSDDSDAKDDHDGTADTDDGNADTDDDNADTDDDNADTDDDNADDDNADTDDDNADTDDDAADHHDTGGEEDTGSGGGRHGSADAPTRYDADVADAAQTITVQVVGGSPVGGHQRVEVELGSVVALTITADTTEEVHVHGYDILRAVSDGHPTHFAFTTEISGVFEVELEGSGRLLLQLEIS